MSGVRELFADVDARWRGGGGSKLQLRIIGCSALMLQTDYERGTNDGDLLETEQLDAETKQRLLRLAGKDSELHRRHRLFIEFVPSGLPFLPQRPKWHKAPDVSRGLRNFEIEVLDVIDVVVSKLKPFRAQDVDDIDAMVKRGLVPHASLIRRLRAAVDWYTMDARATDLPRYVKNLHQVERDLLGVAETEIELPGWG